MATNKFSVKFWGTRGSIASPGEKTVRYGGNTPCVQVKLPEGKLIILDGGTGIRELGNELIKKGKEPVKGHILLSHYHWDHIQGLPFFVPAYRTQNKFSIWGPGHPQVSLEKIISDQMESVYFPIKLSHMSAKIDFKILNELEDYKLGHVSVKAFRVNHPGITFGYKIAYQDKNVVYMTDNEIEGDQCNSWDIPAGSRGRRQQMLSFIDGADLLIHDSQYNDEEYHKKKGWGHSTWEQTMTLALEAGVKKLVLFHHDPDHDDDMVSSFVENCRKEIEKRGSNISCLGASELEEIFF